MAVTVALWAALPGGDRGNDEPLQLLALAALLPWLLLLPRYGRAFRWPPEARRWLAALAAWGLLLLPTAVVGFLPPVLRTWKFTDALVAHAHLAMAGLCSAFAALVLVALAERPGLRGALAAPLPFWAWQGGCATMVVVLFVVGTAEGLDPGLLLRPASTAVTLAYAARWAAGLAMLGAAIAWQRGALRADPEAA
jgi:cytochrome c oxidase cbb3-type subunit 1